MTAAAVLATAAMTACQDDIEVPGGKDTALTLQVGILKPDTDNTRAVVTGSQLPDGSRIGVALTDGMGTMHYGDQDWSNVLYTASGTGAQQKWSTAGQLSLSEVPGTVYAYWPYQPDGGFDMTAIPVDMTVPDQTDWLYAVPVTGVSADSPTARLTMKHALSHVVLNVGLDGYNGDGAVQSFSLISDGLASGAVLDATGGTFSGFTGGGEALVRTVAGVTLTTGLTELSSMVVPMGGTHPLQVVLTVDGNDYTATSRAVEWLPGHTYTYTLTLGSVEVGINSVQVNDYITVDKGKLDMEKTEDPEILDDGLEDSPAGEDAGTEGSGEEPGTPEPKDYILVDGIYYTDDMLTVHKAADGLSGAVSVRAGVRTISADAFLDCSGITSVSLPSSLTSIGASAFEGCTSLSSVTFAGGVTTIGAHAFSGTALASVSLPATLTTVGDGVFSGCRSLSAVSLPSALTAISDNMFYDCAALTSITVPASVASIGSSAFYYCESLASVDLGSGLVTVGAGAFYRCSALTSVISRAAAAPTLVPDAGSSTVSVFTGVKQGGTLSVPSGGSASYDAWMSPAEGCLGAAGWSRTSF